MQFSAMDDEEFDFAAPNNTRSRLSSLFQSENIATPSDVNQALTFTAPKQPKKNDNAQGVAAALKLVHATAVHAYKLKDGNYTNQGKLGCAVLGHHETFTYKLLLYKGKQIHVNMVSITPSFIFHVQPNNYANFYDDKKENWSLNFESEGALIEFTKQVTLAKANSQGKSLTSLVIQDLAKGEGSPLENGDVAEVNYTGWLLSNFSFGQMFDSNMNSDSLFRLRLGKGKVIKGWNEGMLGMQKGGKRLLIVPPDLAYGSEGMGNVIAPNSILIFEIHLIKTKSGHEASSHSPSPLKAPDTVTDKKPEVPPRQSFSQEDNIRMRGASISEQLTQSPKRDKAQLISRMAKMGMATLPFQGAVAAQVSSDSESEVDVTMQPSSPAPSNISRTSSPKAFSKPRSRTNSGPTYSVQQPLPVTDSHPFHINQSSSQMSLYTQSAMPLQQPFVCAATPFPTYQHPMTAQFSSPYSIPSASGMMTPGAGGMMPDSHVSLLLSETRNQSVEVRMGLSKITDKVDTVIQKVDELRCLQGKSINSNMPLMESALILQNIERIFQENMRLKDDVEAKASKIQSLNEIICDLFQRSSRLSEESGSIAEQKKEILQIETLQSQQKISNLEQEKMKLELDLSSMSSKLKKLETDAIQYQALENELNQELQTAQSQSKRQAELLCTTEEKLNETTKSLNSLEEKVKSLAHEKELLEMKLLTIEKEHTKAQGSSDLVEIYKNEIQEHKTKIEELSTIINDSVTSAKLEEEKQKIRVELTENVRLKEEMEVKVKEMKKKIDSYEDLKLSYEDKIRNLEAEIENSRILKKKYEVFQEKTRALKETYEKQIVQLMKEVKQLQTSANSGGSPIFSTEIKKVMNRLYKTLQGQFESDTSYSGSKVLEIILQAIMGLTFQVLENKIQTTGDSSNIPPSSDMENVLKKETPHSEETCQNEVSGQNGVNESEVETEKLPTHSDLPKVNENVDAPSYNAQESEDSLKPEINPLTVVNDKNQVADKIGENSDTVTEEPIKRESPELMLRPQPPPFFDEEDDEEDDDWLK